MTPTVTLPAASWQCSAQSAPNNTRMSHLAACLLERRFRNSPERAILLFVLDHELDLPAEPVRHIGRSIDSQVSFNCLILPELDINSMAINAVFFGPNSIIVCTAKGHHLSQFQPVLVRLQLRSPAQNWTQFLLELLQPARQLFNMFKGCFLHVLLHVSALAHFIADLTINDLQRANCLMNLKFLQKIDPGLSGCLTVVGTANKAATRQCWQGCLGCRCLLFLVCRAFSRLRLFSFAFLSLSVIAAAAHRRHFLIVI
jgi:hypothetical protein